MCFHLLPSPDLHTNLHTCSQIKQFKHISSTVLCVYIYIYPCPLAIVTCQGHPLYHLSCRVWAFFWSSCSCLPCIDPQPASLDFLSAGFEQWYSKLCIWKEMLDKSHFLIPNSSHASSSVFFPMSSNCFFSFLFRWRVWSLLYHRIHHAHECPVDVRVHSKRAQWVTVPALITQGAPLRLFTARGYFYGKNLFSNKVVLRNHLNLARQMSLSHLNSHIVALLLYRILIAFSQTIHLKSPSV